MATPKFVGRDCELSVTGAGASGRALESWEVTREVLRHVDAAFEPHGLATWSRPGTWSGGAQVATPHSSDCLRHWAPNGQCFYADMGHVEVCTAETLSPRTLAAQCLAALTVAEAARRRAETEAPPGTRYALSAANADLWDPAVSWGSHFNVAVAPELWEDLFGEPRHPARLAFVSSAVAAAVPFFGAGHLLPMADGGVVYSLSARAHHLSRVRCTLTTEPFGRGLLNDRREPHGSGQDRLHLIGFDLAPASSALLASFLQCCLAAAEEGFCGLDLYDPVRALRAWSWGLDVDSGRLGAEARLVDGRSLTLFAYVGELARALLELVEAGTIGEDVAPEAARLLPLVLELARAGEAGDLERCARHLDWAAKLLFLKELCGATSLPLGSPEARLADHDYASTDPARGAFWALWERGLVDPLATREEAQACLLDGPAESRAWARGRLIRRFRGEITHVDWSEVELRRGDGRWDPRLRVPLPRLDSLRRERFEGALDEARRPEDLADLLAGLAGESDPLMDVRLQLDGGRRTATGHG